MTIESAALKPHTPGPWRWFPAAHGPYLATPDRGRLIVMDFVRKGMNNAQPRFAVWEGVVRERMGGLMRPASDFGSEDIAHPDARLIAAAPDLFEALREVLEHLPQDQDGLMKLGLDAWIYDARAALKKARTGEAL